MQSFIWGSWAGSLLRHLWQSTVFAGGVWVLTLALRRNAARVRYRLWMAASLKFLLPFSLLIAVGGRLPWPVHLDRGRPGVAAVVDGVTQPLMEAWPPNAAASLAIAGDSAATPAPTHWLPLVVLGVWAAGALLVLGRWSLGWMRLCAAMRRGEPLMLAERTRALLIAENVEPGVFGIVHPVLVLPRGIMDRLTGEQLDAIVAHELSHMRRRDNLTAALHMTVEALFWFHPLVWWLGARLVEERERACDEAVLEATRAPWAYAEGILNVCKFYVEAPLSCVSGVTGSELKQRIGRILSDQRVRRLDLRRKALLAAACVLALGVPVTAGVVHAAQGQTHPAQEQGIEGTWQGTVHTPDGRDLRMVLKIEHNAKGALTGTLYGVDRNTPPMSGSLVTFTQGNLRFVSDFPGFTYQGKISADGNSIVGTSTQMGRSQPLVFERATPETEWPTPPPPPSIPPMAPNAVPGVEVATIKPSEPGARRFMFGMQGDLLVVENLSLNDLLKFAYQLQNREIVGSQGWMETDRWDIEAKPDTPGMPDPGQVREIVQKLLAERFALKVHEERREMAAYVLVVGKDGPKMTKSADASGLGGFAMGPLGVLRVRDATMDDFVHVLQGDILDRPVVNQTALAGRWDFVLKWTPDDTQFAGMGMKPPPSAEDDASASPPLFTAIQQQLGLRLEPRKADVPVLVIDHVERPSPN